MTPASRVEIIGTFSANLMLVRAAGPNPSWHGAFGEGPNVAVRYFDSIFGNAIPASLVRCTGTSTADSEPLRRIR